VKTTTTERVAKAIWADTPQITNCARPIGWKFENEPNEVQEAYRSNARAAMEAMRESAKTEDYLLAAWLRLAPGAETSRGFPRGFWPDVARAAVEMALAGDTRIPLSFVPTMSTRSSDYEEGRAVFHPRVMSGIDVSKLEFKL